MVMVLHVRTYKHTLLRHAILAAASLWQVEAGPQGQGQEVVLIFFCLESFQVAGLGFLLPAHHLVLLVEPLARRVLHPLRLPKPEQLVVLPEDVHHELGKLPGVELLQDLRVPTRVHGGIRGLREEGLAICTPLLVPDGLVHALEDATGVPGEAGLRHQTDDVVLFEPARELAMRGLRRKVRVRVHDPIAVLEPRSHPAQGV
eukprot:UN2919